MSGTTWSATDAETLRYMPSTSRTDPVRDVFYSREQEERVWRNASSTGMLRLAREKGMAQVTANIYDFNHQSREMFRAAGFRPTGEEWYAHQL